MKRPESDRKLKPSFKIPVLAPLEKWDRLALFIGTGAHSGFFTPAPGTWGSVLGFFYFKLLLELRSGGVWFTLIVGLFAAGIWSAGRCERLLGRKDPGQVVIDEIACAPFALWPLLLLENRPFWLWLLLFAGYRLFDILKPYPADRVERFGGGLGVMLDDLVSSSYLGVLFYLVLWLQRAF